MTTFPSYPVLVSTGQYSEDYESNSLRTEFDSGYIKQAPRACSTFIVRELEYYLCNESEYQSFKEWWKTDLNRGNNYFLWVDPTDNIEKRVRIRQGSMKMTSNSVSLNSWIVRFQIEQEF